MLLRTLLHYVFNRHRGTIRTSEVVNKEKLIAGMMSAAAITDCAYQN